MDRETYTIEDVAQMTGLSAGPSAPTEKWAF